MKNVTRILLVLFPICLAFSLQAQRYSIEGTLIADDSEEPLESATIMLLSAADSSLVSFGRSDKDGFFAIRSVSPKNAYILRISYVGYELYDLEIPADVTDDVYDAGTIRLKQMSVLLDEAVVKGQHIPVQIKKDTIEFNANAFKTQENANVEELLRQLPGVEIEDDGNIKAQGENVQRVFVDGKEFFGNDPKIATKNLPAKAIDKVQVFDRKSDQATFSGIDDGAREKAINLTLKEDHKKGMFGSAMAGYGSDERFQGKLSLNRFREDQQFSLIGMGNNINQQGFSFQDYMQFQGGGMKFGGGGGGTMMIRIDGGSGGIGGGLPLDFGNNTGFTRTWAGGLNFNKEWGDKTELNGSYFLNASNRQVERSLTRENFLKDGSFTSLDNSFGRNINDAHRLNATLEHDIDSMSNVKFTTSVGYSLTEQNSEAFSQSIDAADLLINSGDRFNYANGTGTNVNNNLLYRLKFDKPGRFLSTNLTFGLNENNRDGELESVNRFYDEGALLRTDSIMQRNTLDNNFTTFGGNVSFTEPLGKQKYLEINYAFNQNESDQNYEVYDVNNGEENFNTQLSTKFDNTTTYHRGGFNFKLNRSSSNLTLGASVQQTHLDGRLLLQDIDITRSFTNVLPSLRYDLDFTSTKHLGFDYETNVNEPSIEQLSPQIDNSDPFNIYVGNPNLRPEYRHRFGTRFNTFSPFTNINFFTNLNFTYTSNRISTSETISDDFVRTRQPINVDNDYNLSGFATLGFPLFIPQLRFSLNSNVTWMQGINFINEIENQTERLMLRGGFRLSYRYEQLLTIRTSADWSYNETQYSVQSSLNQDFLNQSYDAEFDFNLPFGLSFGSSLNYDIYNGIGNSATQRVPIWNAYLSQFVMNKRGEFRLSAVDILNRNVGVNRTADVNFIQEEVIRSLGQYFMLGFTYSLQPLGGNQGGIVIRRD